MFVARLAHELCAQRQSSAKDFPSACTKPKAKFTKSPRSLALHLFKCGCFTVLDVGKGCN